MPTLPNNKYDYNATARTITFAFADFDVRCIIAVYNDTTSKWLYCPMSGLPGTWNGNVLTISGTVAQGADVNTDNLTIKYDVEAPYARSWDCGFTMKTTSGVDTRYLTPIQIGTGMAVSQTGGNLVVTTGTTASAETILRSNISTTRDSMSMLNIMRSQAIVNNYHSFQLVDIIGDGAAITATSATVATVTILPTMPGYTQLADMLALSSVALVGMKMFIGAVQSVTGAVPGQFVIASAMLNAGVSVVINFTVVGWTAGNSGTCSVYGWNYIHWYQNSATANSTYLDSGRNGWPGLGDAAITSYTTASPGTNWMFNRTPSEVSFKEVMTSTQSMAVDRGTRSTGIPAEETRLYLQIVLRNGSTAPASTTTVTFGATRIEEFVSTPASLVGMRAMNSNSKGLPVFFPATQTVTVSGTATVSPAAPAAFTLPSSAASTNATLVKSSAGTLYAFTANNTAATACFVKFYNLNTAPTVGTSVPVITLTLAANSSVAHAFGALGLRFSAGISYAITNLVADTDMTAIAAAQVKLYGAYI